MSQAIYQTEYYHKFIRQEIVNHVRQNWENDKEWIEYIHNINDVNTYCNFMLIPEGPNMTYGTEYEALVFSRIYNKKIAIFQKIDDRETYREIFKYNEQSTNDNRQKIYFLFSGNPNDRTGHYDLLLSLNTLNTTQSTNQLNDTQSLSQITYDNSNNKVSNNHKNNANEIQRSSHYKRNNSTIKFNAKNNEDTVKQQQNILSNNHNNNNNNLPINYKKRKLTNIT